MSQHKGLLIEGLVRINPVDANGQPTGWLDPLNTPKLSIGQPNPDTKTRVSNKRGSIGQALGTVHTPKPTELGIEFDDQPYEILQMAFMGEAETWNQEAGTVTDEAVTLIPGRWQTLGGEDGVKNINASGFGVAKASTPSTPLVEGTDYEVDREAGLIKAIVGGAISTATPCLIDYGKPAVEGTIIHGGVKTVISCAIRVDGVNTDNGKKCELLIYQADLYQNGEIDVMKRDFISTTLKGTLIIPSGKSAPYSYKEF